MSFDIFWAKYPRKIAKRMAREVFVRMPKEDQQMALDAIHQAIDVVDQVLQLVAAGSPLKPAVAEIAQAAGVSKSELYDLVLRERKARS
jgi:16S rRNA C1402 (ribose-2'-O) methylase RsmI